VGPRFTEQIPILELVTENVNLETSGTTENVPNASVEVNVETHIGHSSPIVGITYCCLQLQKNLILLANILQNLSLLANSYWSFLLFYCFLRVLVCPMYIFFSFFNNILRVDSIGWGYLTFRRDQTFSQDIKLSL